jgi:hypothetical protein
VDLIVRNKANCPKRGTEAVSRMRIADCGSRIGHGVAAGRLPFGLLPRTRAGQSRKTNPICPRTGRQGRGWSESCETKPISPDGQGRCQGERAKQTQFDRGIRKC